MTIELITGDPAGDAAIPAAQRLAAAVRDGDPGEVKAAFGQARADAPHGTDGVIALACTLAAMVPDPRHTPAGELLRWCQHDRGTHQPPPSSPLGSGRGDAALVITHDCGAHLVATGDTSWSLLADALVDLDDALDALPPGVEKAMLHEHRDALFGTWRSLTTPIDDAPAAVEQPASPAVVAADHLRGRWAARGRAHRREQTGRGAA